MSLLYCTRCEKNIDIDYLDYYPDPENDGVFICEKCLEKYEAEQEEKRKESEG